jgi:site-specific DNA recombinase
MTDRTSSRAFEARTLTEYDESLVRQLIEKVTVCEDKFTVEFKSGVTVDVEG